MQMIITNVTHSPDNTTNMAKLNSNLNLKGLQVSDYHIDAD